MKAHLATALFAGVLVACSLETPKGPAVPGVQVIRPPQETSALLVVGGEILAGGREGVTRIDRRTGALLGTLEAPRRLYHIRALAQDASGALWVGGMEGLWRFEAGAWRPSGAAEGLPDTRVNCLLATRGGGLWVGTWGGAARLEGGRWIPVRASDGLADDMVNVMLEDRDGGLWFGSYTAPKGGLSHRAPTGRWTTWNVAGGLPHNNVNGLFQDRDGAVWACTGFLDRGGACRFTRGEEGWSLAGVLTVADGLAGAKARSAFQDRDGVYWFGSEYDGTARMEGGFTRVLTTADGLSGQETKAILQDPDGVLWFATDEGVTRLGPEALRALAGAAQGGAR